MTVLDDLKRFVETVKSTGYRGLILVFGSRESWLSVLRVLEDVYTSVSKLYAYTSVKPSLTNEWQTIRVRDYRKLLGREYWVAVIEAGGKLEANAVAAIAETVRGGGVLVLLCPASGCGGWGKLFEEYFVGVVRGCRNHLIISLDGEGKILSRHIVVERRSVRRRGLAVRNLPEWLIGLVATEGQARVVEAVEKHVKTIESLTIAVIGDRGRGKSAALGLSLALLAALKEIGNVPVVSHTLDSVQQLFKHLVRGLDAAGVRYKTWFSGDNIAGVKGSWFKIQYMPPYERVSAPVIVVDEAAAIGPARLRRLASETRKLVIASTIHGYEGSGRSLIVRLLKQLPKPIVIELDEPIRYPPNDPLEECLYRVFMLDAEPDEVKASSGRLEVREVDKQALVNNYRLLRSIYSVLLQAHYRNMPNDLQLLLEDEDIHVYVLLIGDASVSVLEAKVNDRLLVDVVQRAYGVNLGSTARVVRIATTPSLQGRGYGSKLLQYVERSLQSRGVSFIGASFSNQEALGFWLKNDYAPVYISPRFNKATGEKNIVVLKPLDSSAGKVVASMYADFRRRLVKLASTLYRDVPGETIARMLASCPSWYNDAAMDVDVRLTPFQRYRLSRVVEGDYPELAMDSIHEVLEGIAKSCKPFSTLSWRELLALVMYVVQGKPVWDTVKLVGLRNPRELEEIIRSAVNKLLETINALG